MDRPLEKLRADFERELNSVRPEALQAHPAGDLDRWNMQQVVEHLVLTYRLTGTVLRERLEKGRVTQAKTTLRQWLWQRIILTRGFFPTGAPAPANVVPAAAAAPLNAADLMTLMTDELTRMDALLDECERRFGRGRVASHQMLGPISIKQWRRFHAVHGRHHLSQIGRIKTCIITQLTNKLHVPVEDVFTSKDNENTRSAQKRSEWEPD